MLRITKNNTGNFLITLLIFSMVTAWVFSGWPKVWQEPSIPPEIHTTSAAETLTNGSFTGGITGWTASVTVYDSVTYRYSVGSIRTETELGRNKSTAGTCTHNTAISTNASDTVTLTLHWKKSYSSSVPDLQTISVQIQASGGDWSAPTTIWTETQMGEFAWATSTTDVSADFGTGNYDYRYHMDLSNPNDTSSQTFAWVDYVSLDVVSNSVVSIYVKDTTVAYGTIPLSGGVSSTSSSDTQYAINNGNVAENFNIKGVDTTNWDISTTSVGADLYRHLFTTTTGTYWQDIDNEYVALETGVASTATSTMDFYFFMPTSDSSNYTEQSTTITIQAVEQ